MKKENGAALLTVILIVAVTVTIGAAISSFIMCNFRLRVLATSIERAEYDAEKLVDEAYLKAKQIFISKVSDSAEEAYKLVQKEIAIAKLCDEEKDYTYELYEYVDMIEAKHPTWDSTIYTESYFENYIDNKIDEYLKRICVEGLKDGLKSVEKSPKLIVSATVVDDTTGAINVKLNVKIDDVRPPVIYSADLVVTQIPTFSDVQGAEKYVSEVNKYIGITNWTTQERGYL